MSLPHGSPGSPGFRAAPGLHGVAGGHGPAGGPGFLEGRHSVTVTREEHHRAVLARHPLGRATAELGFATVADGRHRGERAIEVRLAGERIGELTFRMSERYAGLVAAALETGAVPRCAAQIDDGERGRQVGLFLPGPDHLDAALRTLTGPAGAPTTVGQGPGERGGRNLPEQSDRRAPAPLGRTAAARHPAHEPLTMPFPRAGAGAVPVVPAARRAGDPGPAAPSLAGGGPRTVTVAHPGTGRPRQTRRSRRPWLIAGGVALVVAGIVGVTSRGADTSTPSLAESGSSRSTSTATVTTAPVGTLAQALPGTAAPTDDTASSDPGRQSAGSQVTGSQSAGSQSTGSQSTGSQNGAGTAGGVQRTTTRVAAPAAAPPAGVVAPPATTRRADPAPAAPAGGCHPSYTPCLPIGPDLDCGDIRKPVTVIGPDEYKLDGNDKDGKGCESYG